MAKTITMRINDDTYNILRKAAEGERRSISNFIEYAAISYVSEESFVSGREMQEILNNKELMRTLKKSENDIKRGRYKIVP